MEQNSPKNDQDTKWDTARQVQKTQYRNIL